LFAHHLRQLKLPTFVREYGKVAAEAAREGLDHVPSASPGSNSSIANAAWLLQETVVISPVLGSAARAASSAGCVRRSRSAPVRLPKTVVHSSNGRFDVNDGRATFVTLAEYFKEKLRAGLRERHIAEFVDDEQFDGGELRLELQETPLVVRTQFVRDIPSRPYRRAGSPALSPSD
jgi:hypothetical protein